MSAIVLWSEVMACILKALVIGLSMTPDGVTLMVMDGVGVKKSGLETRGVKVEVGAIKMSVVEAKPLIVLGAAAILMSVDTGVVGSKLAKSVMIELTKVEVGICRAASKLVLALKVDSTSILVLKTAGLV